MAYETPVVNGVTRLEQSNGNIVWFFPRCVVEVENGKTAYKLYYSGSPDTPSSTQEFAGIPVGERFGATNIVEYVDACANNGRFFDPATTTTQPVEVTNPITVEGLKFAPYGEVEVSDAEPVVSGNAIYGFVPTNFRTNTAGTGSVTISGNKIVASSGTSIGNFGAVRSFRSLNYKTGQGAVIRFSARFPSNNALAWSGAGGFNIGDEISFGYNGTAFGIWHRYGGLAEVQYLTINVAAGGAETATVTINTTAYSIPLTAGTTAHNAVEIAEYLEANASSVVVVDQVSNVVRIMFTSDGDKTGTFSFSSTGTATGTWAQITAGVTKTSTHTAMADWNVSPNGFDGFDPSKGNSYEIDIKNGFGNIRFYIEDSTTGLYKLVHVITWGNENSSTNLTNPSLRLGAYATALGTISAVTVELAYIAGLLSGRSTKTRNPRSYSNTKSIGTTATNILSIKTANIYNGYANQVEIEPLKISLANDGGKTAIFELRANPTVTAGTRNYTTVGTNLVALVDVDGTTVSSDGTLLDTYVVAKGTTATFSLSALAIRVPPSLELVITGRMTSGVASDLSAALAWYEDI